MGDFDTQTAYTLLLPVGTSPLSPLKEIDCMQLTAATNNRGGTTSFYCGPEERKRLVQTVRTPAAQNTGSITGPERIVNRLILPLTQLNCGSIIGRINCGEGGNGSGTAYVPATFGNITNNTALTGGEIAENGETPVIVTLAVETFHGRVINWLGANEINPTSLVTDQGINNLNGKGDGVRTNWVLTPEPVEPYPVLVYVNDVLQPNDDSVYTVTGDTVSFLVAPECDDDLRFQWFSEAYLVYGLSPVALFYCDTPSCGTGCNTRRSDGCTYVDALFVSNIETTITSGCVGSGFMGVLASYEVKNSSDKNSGGVVTFLGAKLLPQIIEPSSGVCTLDGQQFIAASNGLFEGCAGNFIPSSLGQNVPVGADFRLLAHSIQTDETYILFDDNGVAKYIDQSWQVVLTNGTLSTAVANDIDAKGDIVVTGGDNNVFQISTTSGSSWTTTTGVGDTLKVVEVAIGLSNEAVPNYGAIHALAEDSVADQMVLQATDDFTRFTLLNAWSGIAENTELLLPATDFLLYVLLDDVIYRNWNRGSTQCEAWQEIATSNCPWEALDACVYDINRLVTMKRPLQAAVPDFEYINPNDTQSFDVLANDYAPAGCAIVPASLSILVPPAEGVASVVGGQIEYTSPAVPTGDQVNIVYEVDVDCNGDISTITGVLTVYFLA